MVPVSRTIFSVFFQRARVMTGYFFFLYFVMDIRFRTVKLNMCMQNCSNCNQKFTFGQLFKSFWCNYKPIECTNCKTQYRHTTKNKTLGGISGALGFIIGSLAWASAEMDKGTKIAILLVATFFFTLLFSIVSTFFFSFEREEVQNHV